MVMVSGPGVAVVSPPTSEMPRLLLKLAQTGGEGFEPSRLGVAPHGKREQIDVAARSLGGQIGEIDRQRLVTDGVGRIVGEKMHALDQRVAGGDQLIALGDRQHGGVVAQRQRRGLSGERREIARNDIELAKGLAAGALDLVSHLRFLQRRIPAGAICARYDRECRSRP